MFRGGVDGAVDGEARDGGDGGVGEEDDQGGACIGRAGREIERGWGTGERDGGESPGRVLVYGGVTWEKAQHAASPRFAQRHTSQSQCHSWLGLTWIEVVFSHALGARVVLGK